MSLHIIIDPKPFPTLKEINGAIVSVAKGLSLNQIQMRLGRFTGENRKIISNKIEEQKIRLHKLYKAKAGYGNS